MIGGMGVAGGLALHDQQMANLTMITGLAKAWAQLNAEYYYGTNSSNKIVNHPEMFVGGTELLEVDTRRKKYHPFHELSAGRCKHG